MTAARPVRAFVAVFFVLCLALVLPATHAAAVGFDNDDFIIAGFVSDSIAVYDSDFTFKGNLDASFDRAAGLDFDAAGRVVAAGQNKQVRVYDAAGNQLPPPLSFSNLDLGSPIDLKVGPGPAGNYYVGTQSNGLREFTPVGVTARIFDTDTYSGVAVLPGNVLWGGGFNGSGNLLNVFDLVTGTQTGSITLDNGQTDVVSMFYSAATDTVLLADGNNSAIYERETDGTFLRSFTATGLGSPRGVTRGPGGDVFATDGLDDGVYRWDADANFLGFTSLSPSINGPINILYTGNIPEPATATLLLAAALPLMTRRRSRVGT